MVKTNGGAPGGVLTVTVTIQVPTIPWLSACARALARKAASDKTMLAIPNANFLIGLAPLACSTVSGCLLGVIGLLENAFGPLTKESPARKLHTSRVRTAAWPVGTGGRALGGMRSWLSISGL